MKPMQIGCAVWFVVVVTSWLGGLLPAIGGIGVARAQSTRECRVLNIPRLEPKATSQRSWPGDRYGDQLSRSGIAWLGRFGKNENYAELRVAYDDDGLYVHVNVADLYVWWILDNGPQWGGALAGELQNGDGIELFVDPGESTQAGRDAPSSRALRILVGNYPYWDAEQTATPHLATKTWRGDGATWQPVADPASQGALWFHSVNSSWNEDPGPNNNRTEYDNGTIYELFVPWASLGLDAEPASGSVLRVAARLYDVDDPKDSEFAAPQPSKSGSTQRGPMPPMAWPESLQESNPSTWSAVILNQAPYRAAEVASETTVTLSADDVPMQDVTVGGHAFIEDRWLAGGGTSANYAWETCMDTRFSGGPNALDLLVHPEATPTHVCFFSRALLRYDLSSRVPPGSVVVRATLNLYHDGGDAASPSDGPDFAVQRSPMQVHRLEGDWTDTPLTGTVTWNTAPLAAENVGFGLVETRTPEQVQLDITPLVARAVLRGEPLNMALYGADTTPNSGKYFVASEESGNNPTLSVTFGPAINPSDVPNADRCTLGIAESLFPTVGTGSPATDDLLANTTPSPNRPGDSPSGSGRARVIGTSCSATSASSSGGGSTPTASVAVCALGLLTWRRRLRPRTAVLHSGDHRRV
jgi:hypothetical protein